MRPSDILSVGQEVEAVVLGVNKEEQKISLGLRQLEPNPWDEIEKKFTIGSNVKGKIRNMTAYGAFVELEEGIDGMIHVSVLRWIKSSAASDCRSRPLIILKKNYGKKWSPSIRFGLVKTWSVWKRPSPPPNKKNIVPGIPSAPRRNQTNQRANRRKNKLRLFS